jgi:hypothetical protein
MKWVGAMRVIFQRHHHSPSLSIHQGSIMFSRTRIPQVLLGLVLLAPLHAADVTLVNGVESFANVWIESGVKTLVAGPENKGKALRIALENKPENDWQGQTWVLPLAADISKGDALALTFQARAITPATAMVKTAIGLANAPYTSVLEKKLEIGSEWKDYEISGTAEQDLSAASARFGFTFGGQVQTFEISDLHVAVKK